MIIVKAFEWDEYDLKDVMIMKKIIMKNSTKILTIIMTHFNEMKTMFEMVKRKRKAWW